MGDASAHCNLSVIYSDRDGVKKDEKIKVYHLEEAVIGGHVGTRRNLGCWEERNRSFGRAVKLLVIATNMGYENSMKALWKFHALDYSRKRI